MNYLKFKNTGEITEEFKEVLRSMRLCSKSMGGYLKADERQNTTLVPSKVFKSVHHILEDENMGKEFRVGIGGNIYRVSELNSLQVATLKKVKEFLRESNCEEYLNSYEMVVGIFDDKDIMGYADKKNECIVISDVAFEKGSNYLLETIIEEYIHLKYDAQDETRKFQNGMISEMVKIMKVKNAFAL